MSPEHQTQNWPGVDTKSPFLFPAIHLKCVNDEYKKSQIHKQFKTNTSSLFTYNGVVRTKGNSSQKRVIIMELKAES